MPASIKLQREYGDDLAVILVESQGTSPEDTARFIMKQRWFGTNAMWTHERPTSSGSSGLPSYVLIGADGRVIQKGRSLSSKDHALLDAEIKKAKGAPEGTDRAFEGAWKDFGKGKYGKALEAVAKVAQKKPELAEAATAVEAELVARLSGRLDRVEWMLENGFPSDGAELLDELAKGLGEEGALAERAAALEARLEGEELVRELEADRKLGRALESLFADGRDEKLFERVAKLAEEFDGTKVAERARAFAAMRP